MLLLKGTQLANGNWAISAVSASRVVWALSAGSQAMASSVQGNSALSTLTAACLSSGCLDVGQYAEVVSAFTPASRSPVEEHPLKNSLPQCMAMKACDSPTVVSACAGTTMVPRLLVT